jgi:hypothetical protein
MGIENPVREKEVRPNRPLPSYEPSRPAPVERPLPRPVTPEKVPA